MVQESRSLSEIFQHGIRALGLGKMEQAEEDFACVAGAYLQKDPIYEPHHQNVAAEAFFLMGRIAEQGSNIPAALLNYLAARELGFDKEKLGEKIELLSTHLGLSGNEITDTDLPNDFDELMRLVERFIELEDYRMAAVLLKKAEQVVPQDGAAWFELGQYYRNAHMKDEAITAYRTSIKLLPNPLSYLALASLYEQSNDLEKAALFAEHATRHYPDDPKGASILAACEIREGKQKEALKRLRGALTKTEDPNERASLLNRIGKALDRLDDVEGAITAFHDAKAEQKRTPEFVTANQNYITGGIKLYEKLDLSKLSAFEDFGDEPYKPGKLVFFIGFPRSGTTLVHQILDAHPSVCSVEENAMLATTLRFLKQVDDDYPIPLVNMTREMAAYLRRHYYLEVAKHVTPNSKGVFIDKLPLNILHIAAILSIFPDAKIILGVRHPKAVVLSNLMQHFEINPGMASLMSLDDIARAYVAIMGYWQRVTMACEISYLQVRYEDVVGDLEAEARRLADFMELPWNEAMLDYTASARKKGLINTPSYHQVIQPLYTQSIDRWQKYDQFFKPFEKSLAPFIKEFGYE